jgi:lipid-binding SYLF domain-containing protein
MARISGPVVAVLAACLIFGPVTPAPATASSGAVIARDARAALQSLYQKNAGARALRGKAKGILVFPTMVKAGFMFGGQIGEGALFRGDKVAAFYNSVAASYGFQAGAQKFGYALFFMSESALTYLDRSGGFEVGSGPSLVIVDEGMAAALTTTTAKQDVYAFIFDQRGLMGGIGIQGSKIKRVSK